jgi:hypothetical protein
VRDRDIRQALRTYIARTHADGPDALVVEELGISQGRARVDLALINGTINGFEIKSDRDTLARLAGQRRLYNRCFDQMTVVSGDRHLRRIRRTIPAWWGIIRAKDSATCVELEAVRAVQQNPAVDPSIVVQFLWRDETVRVLQQLGVPAPKGARRVSLLWSQLVSITTLDQLCDLVRKRLKARGNWRSDRRPAPDSGWLPTFPNSPGFLANSRVSRQPQSGRLRR